jgi:hypothetical protein
MAAVMAVARHWILLVGSASVGVAALVLALLLSHGETGAKALTHLGTPDSTLMPPEFAEFAMHYKDRLKDADCLLSMTNEGVLNFATGLPPCGPAFYPVYLDSVGDALLADWLVGHPQPLVVVSTEFWSDKIDGRSMADRLPLTFAVIASGYPVEETLNGRVVRLPLR